MNLIIGTRLDGWGRVRILLASVLLLISTVPWVVIGYMNAPKKPDNIYTWFGECVVENEDTMPENLFDMGVCDMEEHIAEIERQQRSGVPIAAAGVVISAIFWLATGLIGWVFRGFMEKGE